MHRSVIITAFAALGLIPSSVLSQTGDGGIDGVARRAENEEPVAFALVRLLPADEQAAALRQTITGADGRYYFPHVAAGDYRVQLARIGYRPVVSPLLHVGGGETVHHEIRAATEAIQLAEVTVRGEASCLTGAQLAAEPRLAALWEEARKGMETRNAFELRYHFARVRKQDVHIRWRFRTGTDREQSDTLVNEPDSVTVRDQRRRAQRRAEGYLKQGGPGNYQLAIPNEKDLLDEEFLRDHCLETTVERGDGALGLHFRPVSPREGLTDIRGTIWVEGEGYVMRRLAFEWLQGKHVIGQSTIEYTDVTVNGRSLRLPGWGKAVVDPGGVTGAIVRDATATLSFSYHDFQELPAK